MNPNILINEVHKHSVGPEVSEGSQSSNTKINNHCRSAAKLSTNVFMYVQIVCVCVCARGVSGGISVTTDGGVLFIETNHEGVDQRHQKPSVSL